MAETAGAGMKRHGRNCQAVGTPLLFCIGLRKSSPISNRALDLAVDTTPNERLCMAAFQNLLFKARMYKYLYGIRVWIKTSSGWDLP
jgi:hypothetical protein